MKAQERFLCRAKRIDNKEWEYGYYTRVRIETSSGEFPRELDMDVIMPINDFGEPVREEAKWIGIDPDTVCFYTTQNDTNGRRIFEGDIVRLQITHNIKSNYEVYWECFGWSLIHANRDGDNFGVYKRNFDSTLDSKLVIGNKFDNPELVKLI